jgi:hypothetical protein
VNAYVFLFLFFHTDHEIEGSKKKQVTVSSGSEKSFGSDRSRHSQRNTITFGVGAPAKVRQSLDTVPLEADNKPFCLH